MQKFLSNSVAFERFTKLALVVRGDVKMSMGKTTSQCAHSTVICHQNANILFFLFIKTFFFLMKMTNKSSTTFSNNLRLLKYRRQLRVAFSMRLPLFNRIMVPVANVRFFGRFLRALATIDVFKNRNFFKICFTFLNSFRLWPHPNSN